MALSITTIDDLMALMADATTHGLPSRIISFGYPDVLESPAALMSHYGAVLAGPLVIRPDSPQIIRWHGLTNTPAIVETVGFFSCLGIQLDILDIAENRGGEIIADLNYPFPAELSNRYTVVFDGGTLEHCFNIGQAFFNAARLVSVGGYVVHANPFSMSNHGFYNLNPTAYHDFYCTENGFSVKSLNIIVPGEKTRVIEPPPFQRFGGIPENSVISVVVKKDRDCALTYPVQTKYKR
jgi:hypothetical protein